MTTDITLAIFRNKLTYISRSQKESVWERKVAEYYLSVLKPYGEKNLKLQRGFGRGIGGTGDNIICMPVVERDNAGPILDKNNQFLITRCVFDNFQSYLNFIQHRLPVKRIGNRCHFLPSTVNGMTVNDYVSIWQRSQGILDQNPYIRD